MNRRTSTKDAEHSSVVVSGRRPIRILQVVGEMDRGGTETWLMNVVRKVNLEHFQIDFLVHSRRKCAYDDELRALGAGVYSCPKHKNVASYCRYILHHLKKNGPYDVVHAHVHHGCGLVLMLARLARVPIRIAHSHTDTTTLDLHSTLTRKLYLRNSRRLIRWNATHKVACSSAAVQCLFGKRRSQNDLPSILYCGIDLDPFRTGVDRESVRSEFGIGPGHFVIGHVGRFETPKNHRFLLRVHSEVLKHEPNARLFLVGEGSLQTEIRRLADELGIIDTITFAGGRADVPRLLLGVMDAFIFPSVYEGLGLAAVEAQAAGLPSILSTAVPSAADIGSGLAKFIPLTEPPEVWARILLEARTVSRSIHSLERLQGSPFDIRNSAKTLCSLYEQT